MHKKPELTLLDYFSLLRALIKVAVTIFGSSITAFFRGKKGASTYGRHVLYNAFKTLRGTLSVKQSQAIVPNTREVYEAFMHKKNLSPKVIELNEGGLGLWIGDENAETVLLYFHGGGYANPAVAGHISLLWSITKKAAVKNAKLAVFAVAYDLAPHEVYPKQIRQALAGYDYITKDIGKKRSQIIIGGDSAGANLTLAVISHILHPKPDLQAIDETDDKFKAALLISPWVTFSQTAPAFKRNVGKDFLTASVLKSWSDAYMGNAAIDHYNTPLNTSSEWWKGFPANKVLVTVGTDEVLADDIHTFVSILKEAIGEKLEVLIAKGECHDAPAFDRTVGLADGPSVKRILEWIPEQL